ncbi:Polymerase/histidinol phosphatase-like protein [Chaetomium sp. MPI-CAGE-AT-0009]|nr:Polymerase/histidinol phosphatase-like protein [Chaetomium sp. MPI-CAGE-AT-0009]
MLYDLNIAWSPGTPAADLERTLKFAKSLGYDVVALNHIISGPIPTQPTPITNPIPQLTLPHPSYPGGGSGSAATSTTTNTTTTKTTTTPPQQQLLPTTLRRATLTITDPATTNYRLGDFARAYDLVALRPTTERAFAWACATASSAGDAAGAAALVSLDLAAALGWHVHHRTAMAAVQRGVRFEALLRATKGRGVVVSSEARGVLGLRGPADVVNLMAVWGLGPEKGFAALGEGARAVVVNEGIKRRGFRGVVDIVKPAEGGEEVRKGDGSGDGEGEGGNGNKVGKKQKQGQQGQKRKNDGGGNGGGGQTGEVSKRQAKKMRKEASQAKA